MPPEALSKQLEDEGYALVPGVLEPEQVEELRSVLTRLRRLKSKNGDVGSIWSKART